MTAEAVCCDHCKQFYIVPASFSEAFEQERLALWLKSHDCCGPLVSGLGDEK